MTVHHVDFSTLPDRLPDLFVVGGPKCGTTSLFSWLDQHPDTDLPNKEPNFLSPDVFDAINVPGAYRDWQDYLDAMCPPPDRQKVHGDFTPRYLYSDIALQVLSSHPSKPIVVAILRNPIDLVYSLHGQMLRQGLETELDFAKAWARAVDKGQDADQWRDPAGRIDRRLDYPLYGRLGAHICRYSEAIEPDRFRVFVLEEDMTLHPETVAAEILDLLGLRRVELNLTRSNQRHDLRSVWLQRTAVGLRDGLRRARHRLGADVRPKRGRRGTGLMKLINRFNTTAPAPAAGPSTELRHMLADYYRTDVDRLFAKLGRPIAAWRDFHRVPTDRGS